jgi:guanylate kinase
VVFDIDVRGALNLKRQYPNIALLFLLLPSRAELIRRIKNDDRGAGDANIATRLETAKKEMLEADKFDYFIVNSYIEQAENDLLELRDSLKRGYRDLTFSDPNRLRRVKAAIAL